MASQMEWSHDFCLSCDRQIVEGTYCSQACRLADLEKAGSTEQSSQLSSSASSTSSSSNGFYLAPAVNFSALKTPTRSRGFDFGPSSPQHYYSSNNGAYFAQTASSSTATATASRQTQQRSLSPSSSHSSLQSTTQSASGISQQAASQLNSYVRSFDQVRDMKRRYHY